MRKTESVPSQKGMTYAGSGVDVSGEGKAIRALIDNLKFRRKGEGRPVDVGAHFTGIIDFHDHYLSLCTDGVGSKMLIAEEMGKWDTVGIDCMAMNVNDMICLGAEPLAFVDYIAAREPSKGVLSDIGKGLNEGARLSNVSIIGGETASLPDMVSGLDLAGTCMGIVRKGEEITGAGISIGDDVIGIPSSGVHSNGYSLVRKVVSKNGLRYDRPISTAVKGKAWKGLSDPSGLKGGIERWAMALPGTTLGQVLLEPTRIYVKTVLGMLRKVPRKKVHGLAHITGGGLRNLVRLKVRVRFVISEPLEVPPVLRLVQLYGGIEEREMYQTFNMGMGFTIVVEPSATDAVLKAIKGSGARKVGSVSRGRGVFLVGPDLAFEGYI